MFALPGLEVSCLQRRTRATQWWWRARRLPRSRFPSNYFALHLILFCPPLHLILDLLEGWPDPRLPLCGRPAALRALAGLVQARVQEGLHRASHVPAPGEREIEKTGINSFPPRCGCRSTSPRWQVQTRRQLNVCTRSPSLSSPATSGGSAGSASTYRAWSGADLKTTNTAWLYSNTKCCLLSLASKPGLRLAALRSPLLPKSPATICQRFILTRSRFKSCLNSPTISKSCFIAYISTISKRCFYSPTIPKSCFYCPKISTNCFYSTTISKSCFISQHHRNVVFNNNVEKLFLSTIPRFWDERELLVWFRHERTTCWSAWPESAPGAIPSLSGDK